MPSSNLVRSERGWIHRCGLATAPSQVASTRAVGLAAPDAAAPEAGPALTQTAAARPRFPLIDSMRGLAALSVVLYHVSTSFPHPGTLTAYLTQQMLGPPVSAVVVFFLISGFVLYRPFAEARYLGRPSPAVIPYALRRLARIVPGYWIALAIVSVMLSEAVVQTPLGALRYFGFAQLYGRWTTTVQGGISPAWTLCVEVTFYALLPLLALAIRQLGRGRAFLRSELVLCLTLVAIAVGWQLLVFSRLRVGNPWLMSMLNFLPGNLDLFAWGMVLAVFSVWAQHQPRPVSLARWFGRVPVAWWVLGFGAFFAVGQLAGLAGSSFEEWWVATHALKALGSFLLLAPMVFMGPREGILRRVVGSRPLLLLGAISYGVYLWHFPLFHALSPHLVPHGELFSFMGLSVITIAVATASYLLVERPTQRVTRRYLKSRAARTPSLAEVPLVSAPPG